VTDKHNPRPDDNLTLEEIGKLLREARERAGYNKTEVSSRTKITLEQLNCLEEGRMPKLASVYARGFLRTYAELVGLEDLQKVYEAYKALTMQNEEDLDKSLTSKYMENDYSPNTSNALTIVFVILVMLVMAAAGLYLSPTLREKAYNLLPESTRAKLPTLESSEPAPPAQVTAQAPESPQQAPVEETEPAPEVTEPATYSGRLTLRAEKNTWAQVIVDSEPIVHLLFEPGQSQSFQGLTSVNVVAGDGQALRMEWNGQDRGYIGSEGPVEVYFNITPET
jgi:cytoskeletal protein RodZ